MSSADASIGDASMKDASEVQHQNLSSSIPGAGLVHKMSHKAYETAKKTKKSAKSAAKHTQENIKEAAASMYEKTMQMSPKRISSFGSSLTKREDSSKGGGELADECAEATRQVEQYHQSTSLGKESFTAGEKAPSSVRASGLNSSTATATSISEETVQVERKEGAEATRVEASSPDDHQPTTNTDSKKNGSGDFVFELKNNITKIEELKPDRLVHNPSVVAVLLAIVLAAYKGLINHSQIWDNNVPVHVALTWAALALAVGVEIGRRQAAKEFLEYLKLQSTIFEEARMANIRQSSSSEGGNNLTRAQPCGEGGDYDDQRNEHQGSSFPRFRKMMDKVQRHMHAPTWTTLGSDPKRKRQRWERHGHVLVSKSLIKALRGKTPDENRKSLAKLGVSEQELKQAIVDDESLFVGVGTIDDPERMIARSLEEDAIEPMFRLRGMDVFLTDCPENDLADHSFLIENGLRDRPTFIINVLTQWGNVAIYFEMPQWITGWDEFVEKDDDPEDVIALKRFINGNDEYRNLRFKCLPVLVDGPGPMKYMAPPKESCTVVSESLPSTWKFHPAKMNQTTGETILYPCMELESDLMANRTMRSVAALVKRYLVSMVGDVAVLIEKPWGQEEDEPRACLGMCRFDRIDVKTCPEMPPRIEEGETSEERDLLRASTMVGGGGSIGIGGDGQQQQHSVGLLSPRSGAAIDVDDDGGAHWVYEKVEAFLTSAMQLTSTPCRSPFSRKRTVHHPHFVKPHFGKLPDDRGSAWGQSEDKNEKAKLKSPFPWGSRLIHHWSTPALCLFSK